MTVAVVGGGTMGAGIAHVFLAAGSEVVLVESDADRAGTARDRVAESLARAEARGRLPAGPQASESRDALRVVTDVAAVPGDCELVVEAVPEDAGLKRRVLAAAEAAAPDAVLASNTSSLSVGELAGALRRPERCCGMHFFNPVPASAL